MRSGWCQLELGSNSESDTNFMILRKLSNFSGPLFPYLYMGITAALASGPREVSAS